MAILGSTGSIGTQTLEIVDLFPERLRVDVLTAGSNWQLLTEQALKFRPPLVAIRGKEYYEPLKDALRGSGIRVEAGDEAVVEAGRVEGVDVVVAAIVGAAGLAPTLAAVEAGKTVALSNKESLVVAGALVAEAARRSGAHVIPVDSEHSAILQSLVGEELASVESLILTASGGPFRTMTASQLESVTPEQALVHPNWSMGQKVTIDSATLMNKGLEVIEARWLFDIPEDRISVLVHPQSIVHSMVSFADGSIKAQLGVPDMRVPIQYALTYPDRWPAPHPRVDWTQVGSLNFEPPDTERFPCLELAFEALRRGGAAAAALNAANEVAVALFLNGQIGFRQIPKIIERVMVATNGRAASVEDLLDADSVARRRAAEYAGV
ncbi:1-deoxy-D-xylulose-5-phosphate reductoisomerase [soil metagenome]